MPMNPAAAVTWGSFVQAAYDQYASDPGQANPAAIKNMPAGYTLVRTIQMTDFLGPMRSRVFYGFVAAGGDPATAVVALRGTVGTAEWWDDLHWDLVPFTQVPDGGKVARGFLDIYSTYGTMTPGQQQGAQASATFAADVAHAAASGLGAGLDPALPTVVCGHSLGGALATLLVADLTANTPLKPQAWTFASPRVGDAAFAGRYGGLSTVSWRIYNQADVVPHFPVDADGSYQPVNAGYAINSLGKAKWSLRCAHALSTYLHVLSAATVPLNPACTLPPDHRDTTKVASQLAGPGASARLVRPSGPGLPSLNRSGLQPLCPPRAGPSRRASQGLAGDLFACSRPRGISMTLYMYQASYTAKSMAAQLTDPQDPVEAIRPTLEDLGARIVVAGFPFGDYDVLVVYDAPDDMTAASVAMAIAAAGEVKSGKTTRLLTGQEWLESLRKRRIVTMRKAR